MLEREALEITFFVVGVDAANARNRTCRCESLVQHGHEVGNHSFEHEPWMALYDRARIEDEVARAESAIVAATGRRPDRVPRPGYAWSAALLEVLSERGYLYDASTLPTYLGPLARAYYFRTRDLSEAERERARAAVRRFADGLRPSAPTSW